MKASAIIAIVLVVIIVVFSVVNAEAVMVNFVFKKVSISLAMVIIFSTLLGGALVYVYHLLKVRHLHSEIKDLKNQLAREQAVNKNHRENLELRQ